MADKDIQLKDNAGNKLFPLSTSRPYEIGDIRRLNGATSSTLATLLGTPAEITAAINAGRPIVCRLTGWTLWAVGALQASPYVMLTFVRSGMSYTDAAWYVIRYSVSYSGSSWTGCTQQLVALTPNMEASLEEAGEPI